MEARRPPSAPSAATPHFAGPFRLLRYYSLASLLLTTAAIVGLSYVYRQLVLAELTESGESHNAETAVILANATWPEFGPFLRSASGLGGDALRAHPEIKRLDEVLRRQVQGTSVIKIKIYAMNGRTLYSSEAKQIGEDKSRNAGFLAARAGGRASEITHRNQFSAFDQVIENRGVLSSYFPLRNAAGQVEGVFELYDDITPLVEQIDRSQIQATLGVIAVLLALYGALLLIVTRADRILREQHAAQQVYEAELESRIAERTVDLEQAKNLAQAANRAKSQFLANMGHELRTPLNAILGLGHLVGAKLAEPGLRAQVETITRSGRHLLEMVNQVLEMSALEADEFQLEASDFTLPALLGEALGALRERAELKRLVLAQEIDPALPPWLRGDAPRLGRILATLTGNAVKFSEHGRVTLRARLVDSRRVESNSDDLRVRFEVEDQGIGIGAEQRAALFSMFEQADNSTTRRHGGLGLSLALCKRLMQRMGGEIGVSSTLGQGSTFWIEIPLKRALESGQAETRPQTEPAQAPPFVSAAVPTPAQTPPADPAVLRAVLEQLDALLAQSDTAAMALFEQHAAALGTALGAPGEQLGREIGRFEFAAARETVRDLLASERTPG